MPTGSARYVPGRLRDVGHAFDYLLAVIHLIALSVIKKQLSTPENDLYPYLDLFEMLSFHPLEHSDSKVWLSTSGEARRGSLREQAGIEIILGRQTDTMSCRTALLGSWEDWRD